MNTGHPTDYHALTVAEIRRQVRAKNDERHIALEELIAIQKAKAAGHQPSKPLTDHGKAVHARAKEMLNGHAAAVLKLSPTADRENELLVEIDAIDVVIAAYQKSETAARAAEVVEWTDAHRTEWIALVRELVLAGIRAQALADKVNAFLDKAPDRGWGCDLPMMNLMVGGPLSIFSRWDYEDPIREPREQALAEKVITSSDIRKAQNV